MSVAVPGKIIKDVAFTMFLQSVNNVNSMDGTLPKDEFGNMLKNATTQEVLEMMEGLKKLSAINYDELLKICDKWYYTHISQSSIERFNQEMFVSLERGELTEKSIGLISDMCDMVGNSFKVTTPDKRKLILKTVQTDWMNICGNDMLQSIYEAFVERFRKEYSVNQ